MSRGSQRTRYSHVGMSALLALGMIVMASPTIALAGEFADPYLLVTVDAANAAGETAQYSVSVPLADQHPFEGTYSWSLGVGNQYQLQSQQGTTLGTILELSAIYDSDPAVTLNFNLMAGATDTNFTVNSAVVNFAGIANPYAYATASVTVTDENGGGGTLTGLYSGAKAYQAKYNNASAVYATILSPVVSPEWDSATGSQRQPATAPDRDRLMGVTISSISSQFNFQLTAEDSASGTSNFTVEAIPEPATLALLALGGLAVRSRRRRP